MQTPLPDATLRDDDKKKYRTRQRKGTAAEREFQRLGHASRDCARGMLERIAQRPKNSRGMVQCGEMPEWQGQLQEQTTVGQSSG